jgi:opacity protein-like surface antigen
MRRPERGRHIFSFSQIFIGLEKQAARRTGMPYSVLNKKTKRLLACAVYLLIAMGPARAADVPSPPVVTTLPVKATAALPWSWSGFYAGVHVGAALTTTDIADPFGVALFGDEIRSPGFIGGGQIGYNYQLGSMVFGIEADVSGDVSNGTNTCFAVSGLIVSSNCRVRPDLYATLTGRFGYAIGRTMLYAKGGAAWTDGTVDMFFNQNNLGPGKTNAVFTSSSDFREAGWTIGGGIEYALTPAWSAKFEYDYLNFSNHNVATPYVAGVLAGFTAPVAGASEQVHQVKFGLNYRFGAPQGAWPGDPAVMPLKAPAFAPVSSWAAEAGARYMYSRGRFQKDLGNGFADGSSFPNGSFTSKLNYADLQTNSSELFGRLESPLNIFLKGYAGFGQTGSGISNDEDSFVLVNNVRAPYSNSFSPKNQGGIEYAVADLGYDFIREKESKVGAFVGYLYFNQQINRFNCVQFANPQGSCEPPQETPTLSNVLRIQEIDRWQALRIGLSSETMLTDQLKFSVDAAYLPYLTFEGLDNHFRNVAVQFPASSHGGQGAQVEALLSYYLTDRFAVGIGGRYWTMWTTNGQFTSTGTPGVAPRFYRAAFEQPGAFVQASYTFGAEGVHTNAAAPLIFKAPVALSRTEWSGLYVGVEGGGDWGRSKHINSANDVTPEFGVNGGIAGGTIGYNVQFGSAWLFGLEGDMSWLSASGSSANQPPFNPASSSETREPWLSTARIRLGTVTADRWLAYITGGVALADVEAIAHQENGESSSQSRIRGGWTAGAGVEYAFDRNWSAKLEYLHVGLNEASYLTPAIIGVNRAAGVPLSDEIVRAGINYKFYKFSWE